jgi:putative flippase GtrA
MILILTPFLALHLTDPALAALLAKIFATAAGLGWNFFANHVWIFRP